MVVPILVQFSRVMFTRMVLLFPGVMEKLPGVVLVLP
jgi:hypothetical protein